MNDIYYIGANALHESEPTTIICDRCGIKVHACVWRSKKDNTIQVTSGFYDVTGPCWKQFALSGEEKICDECMLKDMRYQNR